MQARGNKDALGTRLSRAKDGGAVAVMQGIRLEHGKRFSQKGKSEKRPKA
jgi:hypothetical protein